MSATLESTGDWTPISGLDTVLAGKTRENVPRIEDLNFDSLKGVEGVRLPELGQFIQLVADGYNIGFNPARKLVEILMRAYHNSGAPDTQRGHGLTGA